MNPATFSVQQGAIVCFARRFQPENKKAGRVTDVDFAIRPKEGKGRHVQMLCCAEQVARRQQYVLAMLAAFAAALAMKSKGVVNTEGVIFYRVHDIVCAHKESFPNRTLSCFGAQKTRTIHDHPVISALCLICYAVVMP